MASSWGQAFMFSNQSKYPCPGTCVRSNFLYRISGIIVLVDSSSLLILYFLISLQKEGLGEAVNLFMFISFLEHAIFPQGSRNCASELINRDACQAFNAAVIGGEVPNWTALSFLTSALALSPESREELGSVKLVLHHTVSRNHTLWYSYHFNKVVFDTCAFSGAGH